ncbi:MAG: glycosyltransferase family 2 protein [Pseudomonas sp.]
MAAARDAADPLISIVIPTYNYAGVLPRAVESVLAQWDERVELIVVDDGSTDDTAAVLRRLQALHGERLQVLRQANAGPAAARNHGLRSSRGPFLLFLDADDELLPGALAAVLAELAAKPQVGLLLGGNLARHPDGREKDYRPAPVPQDPCRRLDDYLLLKRIAIGHGSSVARRELLEARPYPEAFRGGEDLPVFAYLLTHAEVTCLDLPLVRVYKHPTSLRHQLASAREQGLALVDEVFKDLPAGCQGLRQRYAAQRCLSLFRGAYLAGDKSLARDYYRQAFGFDRAQALRWGYLKKAIRLWLGLA